MNTILETLAYILAAWGYLVLWFFAVGTYIRMKDDGTIEDMPRFIFYSLYVMLVPGLVLDFLFNITYGVVHYKQLPRDFLFSGTTARILREQGKNTTRYKRALRWRNILNAIDPDHI